MKFHESPQSAKNLTTRGLANEISRTLVPRISHVFSSSRFEQICFKPNSFSSEWQFLRNKLHPTVYRPKSVVTARRMGRGEGRGERGRRKKKNERSLISQMRRQQQGKGYGGSVSSSLVSLPLFRSPRRAGFIEQPRRA